MMQNFLITGRPGSGKTTLVNRMIASLQQTPYGYRTVRKNKYSSGQMLYWGFWMEDLAEKKCCEISRVYPGEKPIAFTDAFETFGVACLSNSLALTKPKDLLIMDEIGRFEAGAPGFQREVHRVLDADRLTIAILKKEPIPFHEKIRQRPDVVLYDLDIQDGETVLHEILAEIERGREYEKI